MSADTVEESDEPLWYRHEDVYREWLEGDDEVLRAIARVLRERAEEESR